MSWHGVWLVSFLLDSFFYCSVQVIWKYLHNLGCPLVSFCIFTKISNHQTKKRKQYKLKGHLISLTNLSPPHISFSPPPTTHHHRSPPRTVDGNSGGDLKWFQWHLEYVNHSPNVRTRLTFCLSRSSFIFYFFHFRCHDREFLDLDCGFVRLLSLISCSFFFIFNRVVFLLFQTILPPFLLI